MNIKKIINIRNSFAKSTVKSTNLYKVRKKNMIKIIFRYFLRNAQVTLCKKHIHNPKIFKKLAEPEKTGKKKHF